MDVVYDSLGIHHVHGLNSKDAVSCVGPRRAHAFASATWGP